MQYSKSTKVIVPNAIICQL